MGIDQLSHVGGSRSSCWPGTWQPPICCKTKECHLHRHSDLHPSPKNFSLEKFLVKLFSVEKIISKTFLSGKNF